jgi:hypothetical protein
MKLLNLLKENVYSTPLRQLMNYIEKYHKTTFNIIYMKDTKNITIRNIKAPHNADKDKILTKICQVADQQELTIQLIPKSEFQMSDNELLQFYQKFGFTEYIGFVLKKNTLIRKPNK